MQQQPFLQCAWNQGVAYRKLLSQATGLSEARLSQGRLDRLRPSTLARMKQHAQNAALTGIRSEAEQMRHVQRWTSLDLSGAGGWTALALTFEGSDDERRLPLLVENATALDRALASLHHLAHVADFEQFREVGSQLAGSYAFLEEPQLQEGSWSQANEWTEIQNPVRALLATWWTDFHAALDAEWGYMNVQGMEATAVFPFVLPSCPALRDRESIAWKEFTRGLRRPVRRFLELIYAMQHRRGRAAWPAAPPGISELARACSEEEASITNYFDGTKQLRMQSAAAIWSRLGEHFRTSSEGFPSAIAATSICWQRAFIPKPLRKAKHIIIPGSKMHEILWRRHRDSLRTAHEAGEPWPAWLTI